MRLFFVRLGGALALAAGTLLAPAAQAGPAAPAAPAAPADFTASAHDPGLAELAGALTRANDDPRAELLAQQQALAAAAASPQRRFWHWLIQARLQMMLEQPSDATQALDQAEAALAAVPAPAPPLLPLALRLSRLQVGTLSEDPGALLPRADALGPELATAGQPVLDCDFATLQVWLLLELAAVDRAWAQAERVEQCTAALGLVEQRASVLVQKGMLASMATQREGDAQTPYQHFHRALAVLGDRPARYLRSVIEWEMGKALNGKDSRREREHFERARALSQSIGDEVGVAIANVDLGKVLMAEGLPAEALVHARAARATLVRHNVQQRVAATYTISIAAMTRLRDPQLPAEIEAARAWDRPAASPRLRAQLARLTAEARASLGQYPQAYADMQRFAQLDAEGRKDDANRTVLRLQAAYDAAQRDAENARLRLRDEGARLQLESARARQRGLWAALAALVAVLASTALVATRIWRQRRQLADLASRDELTGAPNRRAVMAIARSQWAHGRKLKMPLAVAMLDLDHFKRVNDTWGHDGGDRVLRAFAQAAAATLRAQDRIGRYGGEEWLLVAPGAGADELQTIFRRLRERFAAMPIEGLPHPHGLSFSMGGAPDHDGVASIDALISEADARLYRAKTEGRDRACVSG